MKDIGFDAWLNKETNKYLDNKYGYEEEEEEDFLDRYDNWRDA